MLVFLCRILGFFLFIFRIFAGFMGFGGFFAGFWLLPVFGWCFAGFQTSLLALKLQKAGKRAY
jgi:hypothetical protein